MADKLYLKLIFRKKEKNYLRKNEKSNKMIKSTQLECVETDIVLRIF